MPPHPPTGRIRVPVLTAHGIGDPTAFVELESHFRRTTEAAGNGERLVQTCSDVAEHSDLGDATYPPQFDARLRWVEAGQKPSPESVAERRGALDARRSGRHFVPGYVPRPLEDRVPPR